MIFSVFPCGIQRQSCDELGRIINEFEIDEYSLLRKIHSDD